MKKIIKILIVLIVNTACSGDNFHDVTKIIDAPNQIILNEPFEFSLKLINETDESLQLTIDKEVTKSVQFLPDWYCGSDYLFDITPNPKKNDHDYYMIILEPKDSLIFRLEAELKTYSNQDSLRFVIENYEKDFILRDPECHDFYLNLSGMWLPGNSSFVDAMEGYNFRTKIKIQTTANNR